MQAVVMDGEGSIWDEERPSPEPEAGEVLVRIRAVGICGSDIGLLDGEGPPWTHYPLVPGHEVCAEVVELGTGVEDLNVGDRAVLHGFIYCGTCTACREGRYYQCTDLKEIGFTVDGGYREYATFPSYTLTQLPDDVSDLEATQIDSAACTLHGLRRISTSFDDTAVVLGPGSLGLYGVQLLQTQGVTDIVLTGTRDERLAVGEAYGVSHSINIREVNPVDEMMEYTNGRGVDFCIETAGAGDVVDTCMKMTRKRGSIVLTGVFGSRKEIDPNDIVAKELQIVGGVTASHAIDEVIELFRRGDLSINGIVTHQFDLADYEEAINTVRNRNDGVIKAILHP